LHRDAHSKTSASIRGFVRQSNNYIADVEVLVQRRHTAGWEAGLQDFRYFASSTLQSQLALRRGTAAFGAQPAPEEVTGDGTGRMQLVTGLLQWAKPFNADAHSWQYSSQFQWQWSQTRLTPQDRFCLGGRSSVRGFDGQQALCGDRGQLWRQELSTGLPTRFEFAAGVQIYAALDAGRVTTRREDRALRLAGTALGLRGQHRIAGAYPLQWDVFVGRPLSRPDGFAASQHTTGFNLRAEF
jgi:hemolysin activation/secretion protein